MTNSLKNLSILIVDDNPDMREIFASLLGKLGASIVLAENGKQGLDMALSNHVDIILCDMQMQGGDGLTMLKELRAQNKKRIPLFLTTGDTAISEAEVLDLGGDGILTKPLNVKLIEKTILETLKLNPQAVP